MALIKPYKPFNSLFEMLRRHRLETAARRRPFNSLFEMPARGRRENAQSAEQLSILYLRCGQSPAAAPGGECGKAFNSLFEMQTGRQPCPSA